LFFPISLWIALDPAFSPRQLKLGMPMLTYYYLSALVAGYCAGYFLLFGVPSSPPTGTRITPSTARWNNLARTGAVAGVWILLFALPVALGWRNLGQINVTNGPALREFARQLYADLPGGKSVVLGDDADKLFLLRAELAGHTGSALEAASKSNRKDALLLDAR